MASKKVTSWFFDSPVDFESKKYRLYHNANIAKKMLEDGEIDDAMQFIEDHLVCFYKFKTEKELLNHDEKEIVGIDPILMNLIYKSKEDTEKENKDIDILSDIAELGVMEFEALHSIFRIKWRDIDDALNISYIPEKTHFIKGGFIFLSNIDENWCRLYTFESPAGIDDWVNFKINLSVEQEYNQSLIIDFVKTVKDSGSDSIILNCQLNQHFDSFSAIEFVLSCKIYYKLLKDYMF